MNALRRAVMLIAGIALLMVSQGVQSAHKAVVSHEMLFYGNPNKQWSPEQHIFLIDPASLRRTKLTDSAWFDMSGSSTDVLISPVGDWVYFQRENDIWRVSRNGRREENLTPGPIGGVLSGLSVDGESIVFFGTPGNGAFDVYWMSHDGHSIEILAHYSQYDTFNIEWLPEREQLLHREGRTTYCVHVSGTATQIDASLTYVARPPASPDGRWQSMKVPAPGQTNCPSAAIMRPDCTNFRLLLVGDENHAYWPTFWTIDSQWLLVQARINNQEIIYRIRMAPVWRSYQLSAIMMRYWQPSQRIVSGFTLDAMLGSS